MAMKNNRRDFLKLSGLGAVGMTHYWSTKTTDMEIGIVQEKIMDPVYQRIFGTHDDH